MGLSKEGLRAKGGEEEGARTFFYSKLHVFLSESGLITPTTFTF